MFVKRKFKISANIRKNWQVGVFQLSVAYSFLSSLFFWNMCHHNREQVTFTFKGSLHGSGRGDNGPRPGLVGTGYG